MTRKRSILTALAGAGMGLVLTAGGVAPRPPVPPAGFSKLVFDDEFNGKALNTSLWTPYIKNEPIQNGTMMLASNVSESDGALNLTLQKGSGGIVSTNPDDGVPGHKGFQFTYGYLEARIYLPSFGSKIANWPAFWAVGQNWPKDGEIDVVEGLNGFAAFHFHYPGHAPGGRARGRYTGWHTFAADWEPGRVTYYYDGVKVGQITRGITSAPMCLIIENSGGKWGGPWVRPAVMKIAWVRVWQKPGQWSAYGPPGSHRPSGPPRSAHRAGVPGTSPRLAAWPE